MQKEFSLGQKKKLLSEKKITLRYLRNTVRTVVHCTTLVYTQF